MPEISSWGLVDQIFQKGDQLQVNILTIFIVRQPVEDTYFSRWLLVSLAKINNIALPLNPKTTECSYDLEIFHFLLGSIIVWMFALWKSEKNTKGNLLSLSAFTCYKTHISWYLYFSSFWEFAMWERNKSFYLIVLWYSHGK